MKALSIRLEEETLEQFKSKIKENGHKSISKTLEMLIDLYMTDQIKFKVIHKAELIKDKPVKEIN